MHVGGTSAHQREAERLDLAERHGCALEIRDRTHDERNRRVHVNCQKRESGQHLQVEVSKLRSDEKSASDDHEIQDLAVAGRDRKNAVPGKGELSHCLRGRPQSLREESIAPLAVQLEFFVAMDQRLIKADENVPLFAAFGEVWPGASLDQLVYDNAHGKENQETQRKLPREPDQVEETRHDNRGVDA